MLVSPAARAGETEAKESILFVQKLQVPSRGFVALPLKQGETPTPTLRATSAGIRALKYLGGTVNENLACIAFVDSCFDPKSGGFADTPGGKPDVFVTSVGIMAVVDLKVRANNHIERAVRYLADNTKSFEDIRIAAAALESSKQSSSRKDDWIKEIRKGENPDGTYGEGPGQARATGGAVAALLRLGAEVDSAKVLAVLKKGQRKTGAFGKEDAGDNSDLETTYRVMRTFMMLKGHPDDVPALQAFIAKCRNSDGGYAVIPGQPSTVSGTYYAAIIKHWLAQ